jgi:hypothetical protein
MVERRSRTVGFVPTAEDYRAGIVDLDGRLEAIGAVQRVCDQYRENFGFTGGVAPLIRDGFIAGAAIASATGIACETLRSELERRAGLCDQFTFAMKIHEWAHRGWEAASRAYWATASDERRSLSLPFEPEPPEPPFAGAQVSR